MSVKLCAKMSNGDIQYEIFATEQEAQIKLSEIISKVELGDSMVWISKCLLSSRHIVSVYTCEMPQTLD